MAFAKYYIRDYTELYAYLNESLKRIKPRVGEPLNELLKRKLAFSYEVILKELERVYAVLSEVNSSGSFYRELFKAYVGEDPHALAQLVRRRIQLAKEVYREFAGELNEVSGTRGKNYAELFRGNIGRLLSLYKRINRKVVLVKVFLKEVSKMPDVRGDYVVVIAGLPQVGKSTILSKLTSAKPEIGTYPFTTKTLIAGHISVEPYGRIVLIDSPGVLDSPIEEKNIIERKAVLAVKHLADHMLYVFAADRAFYYTLDEQVKVYYALRAILGDKPTSVVVNKVDTVDEIYLREVLNAVKGATSTSPIPVSAVTGLNLDKLRDALIGYFMGRSQRR
ncbi:MAG: GTPase [Desulfurococcaceae archaeon]